MRRFKRILIVFLLVALLIPSIDRDLRDTIVDFGEFLSQGLVDLVNSDVDIDRTIDRVRDKFNGQAKREKAGEPQPELEANDEEASGSFLASEAEKEVVRLTNIERENNGLGPLALDEELSKVAREKSRDMDENDYFDHISPRYGSPFEMMDSFGIRYRTAGENLAMGYLTPKTVVDGWMNSEGHRANILNGNFNRIGIGEYRAGKFNIYWTQMFRD